MNVEDRVTLHFSQRAAVCIGLLVLGIQFARFTPHWLSNPTYVAGHLLAAAAFLGWVAFTDAWAAVIPRILGSTASLFTLSFSVLLVSVLFFSAAMLGAYVGLFTFTLIFRAAAVCSLLHAFYFLTVWMWTR